MIQFLLLFIFTGLISSLFGDKSRRVAVSLLELSGVYEAAVGIGQLLGRFARRHALFRQLKRNVKQLRKLLPKRRRGRIICDGAVYIFSHHWFFRILPKMDWDGWSWILL